MPTTEILRNPEMLYIAIGILGATVMPHNLYLHSSIVQTRKYGDTFESKREAIRFATIDSTFALMSALFINAAILIMAAATFHGTGSRGRRRHLGRLQAALAAARNDHGEHAFRDRAARARDRTPRSRARWRARS